MQKFHKNNNNRKRFVKMKMKFRGRKKSLHKDTKKNFQFQEKKRVFLLFYGSRTFNQKKRCD